MNPQLLLAIPLLPLGAAILAGLGGRLLGRSGAAFVAIAGVAVSCALATRVLWQSLHGVPVYDAPVYTWLLSDTVHMQVGFLVDRLTALMMVVVTFVSLCVHVYTVGYMSDDPGYQRFFAYIALFTFAMLMLVMANNFLQLFFGWEAVGVVSYLLIGFWYTRPSAIFANLKAFLVNRVGDFGFVLGIAAVLRYTGSLDYATVFAHAGQIAAAQIHISGTVAWPAITFTCICLFIGAMGKSAQVPLHVWLPDSMEGPTPISALIHAATMVTAGIFMVARMSPLFELSETALSVVLVIGATTAFFMGLLGIVNNDIKRVVAYSTLSQLGYMTVALGVSAYGAGIFHLMTHAFFKALLFLAAGSVIHAMGGEQDMRHMGGLSKKIKVTYWTMLIATLAIAGFPPLAGFFSKDSILLAAFNREPGWHPLYVVGLLTALLTAFYMFRLIFLTFHGKQRYDEHHVHVHESPWSMLGPLVILAVLSIIGGWLAAPSFWGGEDHFTAFLAPVFGATHEAEGMTEAAAHSLEIILAIVAVAAALIGLLVAFWLYLKQPGKPSEIAKSLRPIYTTLYNKYYVDEAYGALIVKPLLALSTNVLWKVIDVEAIDGTVNGIAHGATATGDVARRTQSGNTRSYAVWVVVGALAILIIVFWPAIRALAGGAQ